MWENDRKNERKWKKMKENLEKKKKKKKKKKKGVKNKKEGPKEYLPRRAQKLIFLHKNCQERS